MSKNKDYPHWHHKTKKDWLRKARSQWVNYRRVFYDNEKAVMSGSIFYPKEVYEYLSKTSKEMKRMDKIMRTYYKNA